jgi:hypothetical protein
MPNSGTISNDLYLDLLKRVLTNTLFSPEPNADQENQLGYVHEFIQHYMNGSAITMLPLIRLDNLRFCIETAIRENIPGDLIETGVWRGGSTIYMRAILKAHGDFGRTVWVADSFEGLPEPDANRFPEEAKFHAGPVSKKAYGHFATGLEIVKSNFRAFGLLDNQVQFLKGWFKDTLPGAPIQQLAVLRLDGDYYESTWDALSALYAKVAPGGFVIIDDYGEESFQCRKAVEDFREKSGITEPLERVDSKCSYWRKHLDFA